MKNTFSRVIPLVLSFCLLAALFAFTGCAPKEIVNVYNWGEYIDESIFGDFEKETGIKVVYRTFDSNESMYTLLSGGGADYDVVIPSDYMISRLIAEDKLAKLDFGNIPNFADINANYKSRNYDPNNEYSVAYMWGTVGLIYDPNVVTEPVTDWSPLFDEKYSEQIIMFDNPRDAIAIALGKLGYSLNTTDKGELDAALALLQEQKPLLYGYMMDDIYNKLSGGEAALGPYYAGDYVQMLEDNPDLEFTLPNGSNIFIDAMCVLKNAKHKTNAEKFINFMCSPEIGLRNVDATGYSTPSDVVYGLLDEETKNDPVMYPPQEVIETLEGFVNLPPETLEWYNTAWIDLKL
ncbi:MAG: spermidine/putrescine ABC transporter substrate-binding protein [Oscillospiraceae bacterium]|nr:spermidine/putrescine ABC transporter substrate-binding protein [Oscillospiraceae bacterium]